MLPEKLAIAAVNMAVKTLIAVIVADHAAITPVTVLVVNFATVPANDAEDAVRTFLMDLTNAPAKLAVAAVTSLLVRFETDPANELMLAVSSAVNTLIAVRVPANDAVAADTSLRTALDTEPTKLAIEAVKRTLDRFVTAPANELMEAVNIRTMARTVNTTAENEAIAADRV